MVPTTSPLPRRSKGKTGSVDQRSPLKRIRLSVTLTGAGRSELERLAAEKGLAAEEKGGDLTISLAAASPEEALAQLRLLADVLSQKG